MTLLDARPAQMFTIHCSTCGVPHEGENGPTLWTTLHLENLERYALEDDGWVVNVDSKPLTCPECLARGKG